MTAAVEVAPSAQSILGRNYVRNWDPSLDRAFVCDAWRNTARAATVADATSDWGSFREHWNRRIDRVLDSPATRVRIAGPDSLVIRGFLVHRPPGVVHLVFVRRDHRRQGIARLLLTGIELDGAVVTMWSRDLERWILKKYRTEIGRDKMGAPIYRSHLTYDPYLDEVSAQ